MADVVKAVALWRTHATVMARGMVPAVIVACAMTVVVVGMAFAAPSMARWLADLTGATGWLLTVIAVAFALAIVGATLVAAVVTFTAVTLMVGQPFYERLSRDIDTLPPTVGAGEEPLLTATLRGIGEALRLLLLTVPVGLAGLIVSMIPVVGSAAAFVASALVGGWMLALELTTYPWARRGAVTLRARRAALRPMRPRAWGYGTGAFLVMLIPFAGIVMFPTVVAGATRLVAAGPSTDTRPVVTR